MVIDTSIIIDYIRKRNKEKTLLYNTRNDIELCISAITVFELKIGALNEIRRLEIDDLINDFKILDFDNLVALKSVEIYKNLKAKNQLIDFRDLFIGGTCLKFNLPLLTINKKHFERIEGLSLA